MSQTNKNITREIAATNNKIFVCAGSLIQRALFKEIPATNYKTLVHTGNCTTDGS